MCSSDLDEKNAYEVAMHPHFDPIEEIAVPRGATPSRKAEFELLNVQKKWDRIKVLARVRKTGSGWFILNEAFDPGWVVTDSSQKVLKLYQANGWAMALLLQGAMEGEEISLDFHYREPAFFYGLLLFLNWVIFLGWLIFRSLKGRCEIRRFPPERAWRALSSKLEQ